MIRKFFADMIAVVISSTIIGMLIEVVISGMTFEQSIQARLLAVPINLITAIPYGMFRDFVFKFTRVNSGGKIKKCIVDILTFAVFQVPLYSAILTFSGANAKQIILACSTVTIISIFVGRIMGIFIDFFRRLLKV
jgi:exosortase/archaeosortase